MNYYKATISYTIDENHPDIKYVKDWSKNKVYTFTDTYGFNLNYGEDEAMAFIKNDLMLVAGGGYNSEHIHNVKFKIKKA